MGLVFGGSLSDKQSSTRTRIQVEYKRKNEYTDAIDYGAGGRGSGSKAREFQWKD